MASIITHRELSCNQGCTPNCEDLHSVYLVYLGTSNLHKIQTDDGDLWFSQDEWTALLEMIVEIADDSDRKLLLNKLNEPQHV